MWTSPDLLMVRFDAGLFFASADALKNRLLFASAGALEDRLRELVHQSETRYNAVVISFEGVDFVDSQGSAKLAQILRLAENYGLELRLARVKPAVLDLLERDGVIDRLGEQHVVCNVYEACADHVTPRTAARSGESRLVEERDR